MRERFQRHHFLVSWTMKQFLSGKHYMVDGNREHSTGHQETWAIERSNTWRLSMRVSTPQPLTLVAIIITSIALLAGLPAQDYLLSYFQAGSALCPADCSTFARRYLASFCSRESTSGGFSRFGSDGRDKTKVISSLAECETSRVIVESS